MPLEILYFSISFSLAQFVSTARILKKVNQTIKICWVKKRSLKCLVDRNKLLLYTHAWPFRKSQSEAEIEGVERGSDI